MPRARVALGSFGVAERHDELGDAATLIRRCTDRHAVETEWLDDLDIYRLLHRRPGHPLDQLADEEPERDAVVPVAATRRVAGPLGGQPGAHKIPVEHLVCVGDHAAQLMQPGGVAEELANGDALFAGGRELGPVGRDRLVVVDQPAVDEAVQRGGDDALRRRETHGHRVRSATARPTHRVRPSTRRRRAHPGGRPPRLRRHRACCVAT